MGLLLVLALVLAMHDATGHLLFSKAQIDLVLQALETSREQAARVILNPPRVSAQEDEVPVLAPRLTLTAEQERARLFPGNDVWEGTDGAVVAEASRRR